MADPLYDLLSPYFDHSDTATTRSIPPPDSPTTNSYLARLSTLSLADLSYSEPHSLTQTHSSINRSLQALSKRSHKSIINSSTALASLNTTLPQLADHTAELQNALPQLESASADFEKRYNRATDNPILERRRKAMLLARNVDRVSDVLELPTLLSSAISSSSASGTAAGPAAPASASATTNYASALDLQAHIKRLHALYPNVNLVTEIAGQAEQEMKSMATALITSLQGQGIKLAGAMRTIGWLRRVAPELDQQWSSQTGSRSAGVGMGSGEGTLGALFLVCRLGNLMSMLEALEPLRELADQETQRRLVREKSKVEGGNGGAWAGGQQTERYLKRFIEIFREQSFAIISMYKSIFPSALPAPGTDRLQPLPSALASFPLHLVDLLSETLRTYMPNVRDKASRDSLLTQVLYCAGSLGRLGGDFSMMLALLEEELLEDDNGEEEEEEEEEDSEVEWVEVMKKHRVQASRLELLASGVGGGRTVAASG
ncbi:Dor1-domain-containing protein [Saccharata proteae CBS 121410]|uniref:Conserved oligomeric Golgi complex subunit 8 n=1 Tax=Saccharata proteae CBS 121410 TaxID=1314787 RepID=A0A9P4HUE2_9PEZI|nr:Dor1-domain-containing protein [Saccharata proteae CBS 121410]